MSVTVGLSQVCLTLARSIHHQVICRAKRYLLMKITKRFCQPLVAICLFVSTGSITFVSMAHEGATGIVKERMDRFKANKTSLQAMRQALKQEDWVVLQHEAEQLSA